MTDLHTAYAQAIALHQELEARFTGSVVSEQEQLLDQADYLVRAIGLQLNDD